MPTTPPNGLYLTLIVSTLLGMTGAGLGALLFGRALPVRHMLPFGSGLLVGMAMFLVLPEAMADSPAGVVALLCALGWLLFYVVESVLHRVQPDPHMRMVGLAPLIVAVSLHSILDGWNIAVAAALPGRGHVLAFLLGMGVHKLTGGFAVGAIFRGATPRRDWALAWVLACEATTLLGGGLNILARDHFPLSWTLWLLALTAGSFLYLAWHSFGTAWKKNGIRSASLSALAGVALIAVLALAN